MIIGARPIQTRLLLYALCLTERAAIQEEQTIYAFKRKLFRLPIPEHLPQLEDLPLVA
jgi:hypothetical protein